MSSSHAGVCLVGFQVMLEAVSRDSMIAVRHEEKVAAAGVWVLCNWQWAWLAAAQFRLTVSAPTLPAAAPAAKSLRCGEKSLNMVLVPKERSSMLPALAHLSGRAPRYLCLFSLCTASEIGMSIKNPAPFGLTVACWAGLDKMLNWFDFGMTLRSLQSLCVPALLKYWLQ